MSESASASPPPPDLDCLSCGACCRGRPGTVLVEPADLDRWQRAGRADLAKPLAPGHFSLPALPTDASGCCRYHGTADLPHACRIYPLRPQACRDFAVGSPECLAARSLGQRH